MGNGGGTGEKKQTTGGPGVRELPGGAASSHASKRRRSLRGEAMADRFFPNDLPGFVAEASDGDGGGAVDRRAGLRGLLSLPYPRLSDRLLHAALQLKDKVVEETWAKVGRQVTDYTLYTGALGTAFLLFKSFQVTGDLGDLALAADIVRACDKTSRGLPRGFLTFISGRAGVCALGAVVAKHCDDQLMVTQYLSSFDEITVTEKVPNELLYGRAGYLWACLFLNKHLSEKTIPLEHINSVAKDIIKEGRKLSSKGSSPLMYEWHGKKYWGAAHGLAGIMHVLMHTELGPDEQDDVKNTLRYMIKNRFPSGNYPSSEGNESDRLVHWCHGAPGVALTLSKAYEVFQDDHFKQSAAEAAEVVWNRGLLKRVGICHGVSGNAYVFLSLYRLTGNVAVSVDVERVSFGGKEHLVRTRCGSVTVAVYGDEDKPALVTYPDVALNYMSCFQGLFLCPEAASLLLHNFCIYHINPQGHELGAAPVPSEVPVPFVDDLADQVADVLDFFSLGSVMCLGVTAGAYVLTLFATKYRERVTGLMLVSPLCKAPSWSEWLYNKVLLNLLYYYGTRGVVKECLLQRYFSKKVRGDTQYPESDIAQACRSLLDEKQGENIWRFLHLMNERHDLTDSLRKLQCRTLIFVGENSEFHEDAIHMTETLDRRYCALVEVQDCGSLVTEEQPHAMLMPMEYFLMGYGLYRLYQLSSSPRSPLSPCCISPELLSPESMGVKLKPIKTRVAIHF